jgi:glycosyltransferase involved in cell wall biosynthesis
MPEREIPSDQDNDPQSNIVAIIPAYNEERFIGSVVLSARAHADQVIVVDDGSTDSTAELARAAGAIVVRHTRNMGKAAALNTGFEEARRRKPCAVVLLDGDGQHQASEIPILTRSVLSGEADMVVGSRFLDTQSRIPYVRSLGLRGITMLSNLGSGISVSDSQTGFRAFSREALERMSFRTNGFSVESEMQFLARTHGLKTAEVPISCTYQDAPKRSVVAQGLEVVNGILQLIGQHRPLLFFGVPGLLALVSGLAWGAWVVDIYNRSQQLAVGYALIAVLLCIVGSVTLSTGIILHSLRGLLLELLGPKA